MIKLNSKFDRIIILYWQYYAFYRNGVNTRIRIKMTTFQTQLLYTLGSKTKILSELKKVFVRPLIQSKFYF